MHDKKDYVDEHVHLLLMKIKILPFLCIIGDTVMVECTKHLNSQNSIEEEKEEQKYSHTPDLFP